MKEILIEIFGRGKDLSAFQMCLRTVVVFIITLTFVRLAGKRSFGMRMPMDNVITILLGALLSRAITGASPFIATVLSGLVIIVLYRLCATLSVFSKVFGKIVKGEDMLIYKDGKMLTDNMERCMVTEKDLIEEVRLKVNTASLDKVDSVYVERNGELSVVKKENT